MADHSSSTQLSYTPTIYQDKGINTTTYQEKVINTSLKIFLWETQPDRAIFDWYISLQDKSRYEVCLYMICCYLEYIVELQGFISIGASVRRSSGQRSGGRLLAMT